MRQTYTVVTMEVSQAAFMEIHAKILGAGYEHALMKVARDDTKLGDRDAVDMTGIALTPSDDPGSAVSFAEHLHTDGARLIDGARGSQEAMNQLLAVATRLMECAEEHGFVLTITERSLKPLAMGHTETVALVRPRRDPSDPAGYVTPHLADGDEAFKKPPAQPVAQKEAFAVLLSEHQQMARHQQLVRHDEWLARQTQVGADDDTGATDGTADLS